MRWMIWRRRAQQEPSSFPRPEAVEVGDHPRITAKPHSLHGQGGPKKIPDEKGHSHPAIGFEREGVRSHTGEYQ